MEVASSKPPVDQVFLLVLASGCEHTTSIGSKAGWTGRACGVTSTPFGAAISPRTSSIAIIGGDFAGMRAGSEAVSVGSLCQFLG